MFVSTAGVPSLFSQPATPASQPAAGLLAVCWLLVTAGWLLAGRWLAAGWLLAGWWLTAGWLLAVCWVAVGWLAGCLLAASWLPAGWLQAGC